MTKTKRTLIPTDFTVGSLTVVIDYLSETSDTAIDLILAHGQKSSDSITELLGFDKHYYLEKGYRADFLTACQIIKTRFEDRVNDLYSDIISSKNDAYIRNYLKGNKIDTVILPDDTSYSKSVENSFCVLAALRKNCLKLNIPILEIATTRTYIEENRSEDSISNIFFRKNLKNATY